MKLKYNTGLLFTEYTWEYYIKLKDGNSDFENYFTDMDNFNTKQEDVNIMFEIVDREGHFEVRKL